MFRILEDNDVEERMAYSIIPFRGKYLVNILYLIGRVQVNFNSYVVTASGINYLNNLKQLDDLQIKFVTEEAPVYEADSAMNLAGTVESRPDACRMLEEIESDPKANDFMAQFYSALFFEVECAVNNYASMDPSGADELFNLWCTGARVLEILKKLKSLL